MRKQAFERRKNALAILVVFFLIISMTATAVSAADEIKHHHPSEQHKSKKHSGEQYQHGQNQGGQNQGGQFSGELFPGEQYLNGIPGGQFPDEQF